MNSRSHTLAPPTYPQHMTRPQLIRTLIVLATIATLILIGGILIQRHQDNQRRHDVNCMLYGGYDC